MNIKRIRAGVMTCLLLALLMAPAWQHQAFRVYAEEAASEESTAGTEEVAPEEAVEYTNGLIRQIKDGNQSYALVVKAREAYDALTLVQQMQVEDYEVLVEAEEAIGLANEPVNEEIPTDEAQTQNTKYSIAYEGTSPLTVSLKYVTDEDGDGRMDTPLITITTSKGNTIELTAEMRTVDAEGGTLEILRAPTLTQITFNGVAEGVWTIRTSNEVLFSNRNAISVVEPAPMEEESEESSAAKQQSAAGGLLEAFLPLILLGAAFGGFMVFMKKLPQIQQKKKNQEPKEVDAFDEIAEDETLTDKEKEEKLKALMRQDLNLDSYNDELTQNEQEQETSDDRLSQTLFVSPEEEKEMLEKEKKQAEEEIMDFSYEKEGDTIVGLRGPRF